MDSPTIVVVGGGPAGVAAAVTAHSLGLKVVVLEREVVGGQVRFIERVDNVPGAPMNGKALASRLRAYLRARGIPVLRVHAHSVERYGDRWRVTTGTNRDAVVIECDVVVAATGTRDRAAREHGAISGGEKVDDLFLHRASREIVTGASLVLGSDRPLVTFLAARKGPSPQSMHVVALPDRWHVVNDIEAFGVTVVRATAVEILGADAGAVHLRYRDERGVLHEIGGDRLFTNLGKVPNAEAFRTVLPVTAGGFLPAPVFYSGRRSERIYAVGDVAHEAFQRIPIAQGEGTAAILDYYYASRRLYGRRLAALGDRDRST